MTDPKIFTVFEGGKDKIKKDFHCFASFDPPDVFITVFDIEIINGEVSTTIPIFHASFNEVMMKEFVLRQKDRKIQTEEREIVESYWEKLDLFPRNKTCKDWMSQMRQYLATEFDLDLYRTMLEKQAYLQNMMNDESKAVENESEPDLVG